MVLLLIAHFPNRTNYTKALDMCGKRCLESISYDVYSSHQKKIKSSFQVDPSARTKSKQSNEIKLRLLSEMKKTVIHRTSQRIELCYDEIIDINGVQTSVKLCENCFININDGVKERCYHKWKQSLKKRLMIDSVETNLVSSTNDAKLTKDSTKQHFKNIFLARKALGHLGLEESALHMACLPDSPAYLQAYQWLANFFALIGDYAPNRDNKVQLPGIYTKSSIYDIYRHHVTAVFTGDEHEPLSKTSFFSIWKNIFPNVSITKFCQVSGKCSTCHWLYERQEVFRSERQLEAIKYFANIHKILIQMERSSYVGKRQKAQERPDLYMSLIIDGMSQDHCILPYCGNKVTKNNILKQKIVGAKQHGFSRSFCRTFPHISCGSNVAIEVLAYEIEKRVEFCTQNNLEMPEILYLQIDGGPENTSKVFYAFLHQLVENKVFKKVEICRLPVGHTHEDIDALFGLLWRSARHKTLISPQDWKRMALETFSEDFGKCRPHRRGKLYCVDCNKAQMMQF
jgi:hypothetical protein